MGFSIHAIHSIETLYAFHRLLPFSEYPAATEYLQYLYSDEAQRIAGDNYYRPSNEAILNEYANVFDLNVNLVTIQDFGGWDEAQTKHFADGGIFDEIYEKAD